MSALLALTFALLAQDPAPRAIGPTNCPRMQGDQTSAEQHEVFCFVGWLYGPGTLETVVPLGDDAPRVFTAGILAEMDAARRRGGEYSHPAFDADPICDCQDPGGLRMLSIVVPQASAGEALAEVHFDFGQGVEFVPPEDRRHAILHLKKEAAGWRIDDIRSSDGWSFRASLAQ